MLYKFKAKNKRAIEGIKALLGNTVGKASDIYPKIGSIINAMQGQLDQALNQAKSLLREFPNSVMLYNICGVAYQGSGQLDAAISNFEQALSIKPDYAASYNNMGIAFKEKVKPEEAIEAYKKALAIKPDYAEAFSNMGNAFQDLGKLKGYRGL